MPGNHPSVDLGGGGQMGVDDTCHKLDAMLVLSTCMSANASHRSCIMKDALLVVLVLE